ncbi:MAG: hypothetical protein OEZ68_15245 [Gammaproteobacteria bacterium]|nr:hypothetical protein [Gammaproteobacteria bacterium]MDH5802156.1 hypothetical protein [Gammaproteobacteria bacterium]
MELYTSQKCAYCRARLTIHQKVRGGVCASQSCKLEKAKEDARNRRELQAQHLRQRVEQLYQQQSFKAEPDSAAIAVLPANTLQMRPIPDSRKVAFVGYLNMIADELATTDLQKLDEIIDKRVSDYCELFDEERKLLGKACATCRGYCCVTVGEKNAFLDAIIMRRFWRENPQLTTGQLVDLYTGYIASECVEHSCLYHSDLGCRLPRNMRAYICNEYLCPPLLTLRNDLKQLDSQNVFAAATRNQDIVRFAYFDKEQCVKMWQESY